jgi:CRP-like cAMP-binding protein
LVGVQGLIHTESSPASAIALNEIYALVLTQKDFEEILKKDPLIAIPFLKLLADRMHGFNLFLEHLLSNNLYDRTWKMLQGIAPYFPDNEITLSQEQFSDLIWGTRSRVTEVLVKLENEGKIITTRRKIKVL